MTTPKARLATLSLLALSMTASSCGYRPPRFANRKVAARVDDMQAIPIPERQSLLEPLHEASVYVRRELVRALEPRRAVDAGDVNALDDVPESSWFLPASRDQYARDRYHRDGPPVPPLSKLETSPDSETPDSFVVVDARGLRYELRPDEPDRPAMRSGAMAGVSRLLFALGYRTAEVHVILNEGVRFAATRWPVGIDLGHTTIDRTRGDDPNDRLDHRDRRSLRAFKLAAAWLDIVRLPPRTLRDHYVGAPGSGHVEHSFVGIDGGLGVDRYYEALAWRRDPDRSDDNFFLRLVSLGLSPVPSAPAPLTAYPSVGLLGGRVLVRRFKPSPPFEPIDRMLPPDAYWMAKQIARVPAEVLRAAIVAAALESDPSAWLERSLEERRAEVVAWGYDQVSPLEVGLLFGSSRARRRASLQLIDLAVMTGMTPSAEASYQVRFLDPDGADIEPKRELRPAGAVVRIDLPESASERDYVIVRALARRRGVSLPRPAEFHLAKQGSLFALVGVRH